MVKYENAIKKESALFYLQTLSFIYQTNGISRYLTFPLYSKYPSNSFSRNSSSFLSLITIINGYARKKGYWVESKSNTSLYPILKDRLFNGIVNSIRLRKESHQINPESVIYERNPYITTDYLVARILGYTIQENKTFDIKTNGTSIRVNLDGNTVSFYNEGTISYILQSGCIRLLDPFNNTHTSYNDRPILIEPTKSYSISLADKQEDHLLMLYISDENYIIG